MAFLRDFRSKVARLKELGLVSDVDARSAYPTWKRDGVKLSTLVDRYDDVLSGKVTPVKTSRLKTEVAKNYPKSKGKTLVSHSADEKVRVEAGAVVIESKVKGITRVDIPIPFHNAEQWARDVKKNQTQIDRLKKQNEWFGFRFGDNRSHQIFRDIDLLIEYLTEYEDFQNVSTNPRDDAISLEIVKITNGGTGGTKRWFSELESRPRGRRVQSKEARRRWYKRAKLRPGWKKKRREEMRKYRAKKKGRKKRK
jgi:hypothetical protein